MTPIPRDHSEASALDELHRGTPPQIPEVDFAALAGGVGVAARTLADLDRLAACAAEDMASRPVLVLDCRISGAVVATYQQEIMHVNS